VQHFLPEYVHDKWYQAGLTVQGKIANLDFTYAGSYMDRKVHSSADYTDYTFWYDQSYPSYVNFYDNSGTRIDPTQRIIGNDHFTKESHEVRLASSKDNRFRFQVGGFYEKQTHAIIQDYVIPGLADPGSGQPTMHVTGWPDTLWLTDEYRVDKDWAGFGEASFDILPSLTITGGIRFYSYDNTLKGFYGFNSYETSRCFAPTSVDNGPCTDINSRAKGSGETHKVNLTWNVTDDKLLYATYSTGFRPGGANRVFDPSTGKALPAYSPDSLDNYEIGWKSSWYDNRLRFNGAVYYEQWNNFQFPFLGANSVTIVGNAKSGATVKGFEYDLIWLPLNELTLSTSGAYNNGSLDGPYCKDQTIVCTDALSAAPTGTQLPITPLWKINGTARYEWTLDGDMHAHLQGSFIHSSGTWSDLRVFERSLLGKNKTYTMFDFTAGIDRDNWALELYIKNAFDERAQLGRYAECTPGTCGFQPYILASQPRTIGITWSQKF
jgi:outer membrane receptor protein involved in Fe transport